jgi:hypothetical protein
VLDCAQLIGQQLGEPACGTSIVHLSFWRNFDRLLWAACFDIGHPRRGRIEILGELGGAVVFGAGQV